MEGLCIIHDCKEERCKFCQVKYTGNIMTSWRHMWRHRKRVVFATWRRRTLGQLKLWSCITLLSLHYSIQRTEEKISELFGEWETRLSIGEKKTWQKGYSMGCHEFSRHHWTLLLWGRIRTCCHCQQWSLPKVVEEPNGERVIKIWTEYGINTMTLPHTQLDML